MDKTQAQNEDYLYALNMCIGLPETQRYSLDGTKLYVKTTQEEIDVMMAAFPDYTWEDIKTLTFSTEYTYEEILLELQKAEWSNEVI